MGGGGGGSSDSTVYQYSLSPVQEPYFQRMMDRGEAVSNTPYIPYPSQRLSEFTDETQRYFAGVRGLNAAGTPGITAGAGLTGAATAAALQAASEYDPMVFYSGKWDEDVAKEYMNPYTERVLDAQLTRLQQRFDEQQQVRNKNAVDAGAFGGYRRYIEDAAAQREMNRQQNEIEAAGLQAAYEQAMAGYDKDRLAAMEAQRLHDASRQYAAAQKLQGLELGLSGAQQMAGIDELNQALTLQRLGALKDVGLTRQALEQERLNIAYTDFENQRDYQSGRLQQLNSLLRGVPISASSSVTQNQADPNLMSQLTGLGLGIYGLQQSGFFNS